MRRLLPFAALLIASSLAWAKSLYDFGDVDARLEDLVVFHGLAGATLRLATPAGEVHRAHAGGYTGTERLPLASASKWLSALTLARLVENGTLRWNDTVGDWIPEAPVPTRAITVAMLFSHTSGIPHADADCLSRRDVDLQQCAAQILALPLADAPGTAFAYGGNSMQVAGAIAERATGQRWDRIFIDEVVAPLGLTHTDWTAAAPAGSGYVWNDNPRIGGGARSTLRDYAIVVDMLLAGGLHEGANYLRADTLATMALDRARGLPVVHSPAPRDWGYGLGQWVEARDAFGATVRVSSPGAFGFTPWVDWRMGNSGIVVVYGSGPAMRDDLLALEHASRLALAPFSRTAGAAPRRGASVRHRVTRAGDTRGH
jgi:CubicO group peptidase (beta-lactamase class C family)